MKDTLKNNLRYILPIIAILAVNFIYFYPVLQGKVLDQEDIKQGNATRTQIKEYREANGEEALWAQSMFSGMPTFLMGTYYANNWAHKANKAITYIGGKGSSIYIVFSLMLFFYFLLISQKIDPWLSLIGAIAFAFSAFFIISYGAGHNTKIRAVACIPGIIMGILITYNNRQYLKGFALTALFVALAVKANHLQITYYTGILALIIALVELVYSVREKALGHFAKASGILILAAMLGIGPNISSLWSVYDYSKETIRGGSSELSSMEKSKGGLTLDYAMGWSYGKDETFNLIIPNFKGGGVAQNYEGTETHEQYFSNVVRNLTSNGYSKKQAEKQANQYISSMFYWGEQSVVNGGYYVGAVVFFLFVLGFFIVKGRMRWWISIACALAILMAWGENFLAFNEFLFNNIPLYNKFRVPSMTLTIVYFSVPFFAFIALNKVIKKEYDPGKIKKQVLNTLYITGGICLLFVLLGGALFDFSGARDAQLAQQGIDVSLLENDRLALLRSSALKTLVFCGLTFGLIWLFIQDKLKLNYGLIILAILIIADQWSFTKQHVGADQFVSKKEMQNNYAPSVADRTILQDKDTHYRVFNTTANITYDSFTSEHHNSIGGYSAAKLIRYQDLIENQLTKSNMACFNMLNTKWFIIGDKQTGQKIAQPNPNACGNAWFVNELKVVENADAEMAALNDFDPKNTAIVDQRYKENIPSNLLGDGASTIVLSNFDLKHMTYEANVTSNEQFAVFSEIYYEGGNHDWKAYLDGEPVDHIRVDYVLRGMTIPQGKHTIEFKFEPRSYIVGEKISLIFSIILTLALLGALVSSVLKPNTSEVV